MDATGATLPEFDGMRDDAIAAPEGREGDFAVLEFGFNFFEFLEQDFFGSDDFGLVGNPSADLGFARAGHEVFQRFRRGDFFSSALDDDLAFEGDPWEQQADFGIGLDVLGFTGLVIGKKGKTFLVKGFEQDRALGWKTIRSESGECHRVGFRDAELGGLLEPTLEKLNGIGAQILTVQAFGRVFFSEIG